MMMEHGFAEEMNIQEDLTVKQSEQEGWIGRIKGAIAGDEKAEPFQFKSQVNLLMLLITDLKVSCPTQQYSVCSSQTRCPSKQHQCRRIGSNH